jgi:hypothetical protein
VFAAIVVRLSGRVIYLILLSPLFMETFGTLDVIVVNVLASIKTTVSNVDLVERVLDKHSIVLTFKYNVLNEVQVLKRFCGRDCTEGDIVNEIRLGTVPENTSDGMDVIVLL